MFNNMSNLVTYILKYHIKINPQQLLAKKKALFLGQNSKVVEAMGFEPTTSWSRTKRATKLHHASI